MAHECTECGQQCYCDMDDCGGFPQPSDCPHLSGKPGTCDANDADLLQVFFEDYDDDNLEGIL